jgi:hypothetical protein
MQSFWFAGDSSCVPRWRMLIFFVACVGGDRALCTSAWGGDAEVRALFVNEYGSHAGAVKENYASREFTYTSTDFGAENDSVWEVEGKSTAKNFLLTAYSKHIKRSSGQIISQAQKPYIEVRNRLYSFTLFRKAEGEYVITDLRLADASDQMPLCQMMAPFADYGRGMTYLELAQDEGTRFLSFEDCTWQNKPMKELRIGYTETRKSPKKSYDITAAYYFSPQDGWICCCQRWWAPNEPKEKYVENIYFYESRDGEAVPSLIQVEVWERNEKDAAQSRRISLTEVSQFRRAGPFPDTDFRLSAFGLPEPEGVKWPQPPRTWLWLILAGSTAALVAMVFWWLKHRHPPTPLPESNPG